MTNHLSNLILLFLVFACGFQAAAQNWQPIEQPKTGIQYAIENPAVFQIDFDQLQSLLLDVDARNAKSNLELPLPDGSTRSFEFDSNDFLGQEMKLKFQEIRTFNIRSGRYNGKADITYLGFHAMIFTPEGTVMIQPALDGDRNTYVSFYTRDLNEELSEPFYCETGDDEAMDIDKLMNMDFSSKGQMMGMKLADPVILRTFRLTVSCTGEYATRTGGTVQTAMSVITTQSNRASGIFEREHAVKLVLVNNNEELIFLDPETDPFNNSSLSAMLGQNITTTNERIGSDNYDVGHVMGTVGGGLAMIRSTCTGNKAGGATGQNQAPSGFLALMVFCHELGHQFGANHTFNNCEGNESFGTAYEPGSGSTIMSYAGLCGSNNVQSSSDDFYHVISLMEVRNFITTGFGNTCAVESETGNTHPQIEMQIPSGLTIPIQTPFHLTANAFDQEDNVLYHNWDQFDLGPQSQLGTPLGTAPLFRFQVPQQNPNRYLPRLQDLAPGNISNGEVLPSTTRPINFRFVVRDQNPNGGGASWAPLSLQSTELAGPFTVLNPLGQEMVQAGEIYQIVWDVANTNIAPVNCQFVDIMLSRNSGFLFTDTLATRVANKGYAYVTMPTQLTNNARIMVKANDNIFFNITTANFRIIAPPAPTFTFRPTYTADILCTPASLDISISTISILDFDGPILFSIEEENVPEEAEFRFNMDTVQAGDDILLTLDLENFRGFGTIDFLIVATDTAGQDTVRFPIQLNVRNLLEDLPNPIFPETGSEGITPPILFEWEEVEGAEYYNFFLSDNPSFPPDNTIIGGNINTTSFSPGGSLSSNTLYYWKVEAHNICGYTGSEFPSLFHTEVLTCVDYQKEEDIIISATGMPIITSDIEVSLDAEITTIEIPQIHGSHQWFSDLDFFLFTPDGSEIRLISRQCANFNGQFGFGLSDFSTMEFTCPPNQNLTFKPDTPFSSLAGETASGTWTMRIRDLKNGGGGRFNGWSMNLCSSSPGSRPMLERNEPLVLKPGGARHINNDLLLAIDDEKSAGELVFTLVKLPEYGLLMNGSTTLEIGDTFTQQDINDVRVQYVHMTDREEEDRFFFTVRHNGGGWIGIQEYLIITDDDFTSSTKEVLANHKVDLFPNPANTHLNLLFHTPVNHPVIHIYSAAGQLVSNLRLDGTQEMIKIELGHLPHGAYFIQGISENYQFVKRFIKQ